jgi:hypothetical protein
MDIKDFQDIIIHDLLSSNKHNSEINDSKAAKVTWSQRIFLISLVIIPIIVIIVLHAFTAGSINITR